MPENPKCGSQVIGVKFSIDNMNYIISLPYTGSYSENDTISIVPAGFGILLDDAGKEVETCDYGSEQSKQPYDGTLNGIVDYGKISGKEYDRFRLKNIGYLE